MPDPLSLPTYYGFIQNFQTYQIYMQNGQEALAQSRILPKDLKTYDTLFHYLQQHPASNAQM